MDCEELEPGLLPDLGRIRAWCIDLGLERAAVVLRPFAPQITGPPRHPARAPGGCFELLRAVRELETAHRGTLAGEALVRVVALVEEEAWA